MSLHAWGGKAARVFRSRSVFVEDEGGTRSDWNRGRGRRGRERVKQRVLARGIIALLQIIGQTPTRGERVCACVHVHACVEGRLIVGRYMLDVLYTSWIRAGDRFTPENCRLYRRATAPSGLKYASLPFSPFQPPRHCFLSLEWRRRFSPIFPA